VFPAQISFFFVHAGKNSDYILKAEMLSSTFFKNKLLLMFCPYQDVKLMQVQLEKLSNKTQILQQCTAT